MRHVHRGLPDARADHDQQYEIADDSRENLIWTKEQLLVPLLPDMEAPPAPSMRLGDDEKDYYRLGAASGFPVRGPRAPGMSGPGGGSGPAVFAGSPDASLSWASPEVREEGAEDL